MRRDVVAQTAVFGSRMRLVRVVSSPLLNWKYTGRPVLGMLMMKKIVLLCSAIVLAVCNLTADNTTPTPLATAITIIVTPTPQPQPSATVTLTSAPTGIPTLAPTETAPPTSTEPPTATYTPSTTPTASITPQATVAFRFDNWEEITLPNALAGGITVPLVVFTNSNDQTTIRNLATAQPENTIETIFLVNPNFPTDRIELLQLNASTGSQIYPAEA